MIEESSLLFCARVVLLWNSLSDNVILVTSFIFWENQEIMYNFKAQLTGTGLRR